MTVRHGFTVALFLLFYTAVFAEYRAFELKITNQTTGTERTITSTLDDLQYPRYHPLGRDELITYVDSWMCFDNMSDFKAACPKPNSDPQTLEEPELK